ncbi:hypothetical protein GA0115245_144239 [Streptomyces sp. di188]|nr:hypothetical protein GA0115245_144239 [Streptomyces sp. di188]
MATRPVSPNGLAIRVSRPVSGSHPALGSSSSSWVISQPVRKDQHHRSRPSRKGTSAPSPSGFRRPSGPRPPRRRSPQQPRRRSPLAHPARGLSALPVRQETRRPFSSGARSSRRGLPPASTHRSFPFRAGRSDSHMEVGVSVIMHDLVSPCQLDRARFTPVRAPHASRVTGFARPVCPVHGISHEDSSGWSVTPPPAPDTFTKRGTPVLLAAPVTAVLGGGVPPHGTRSEVVVRRAGGIGALAGSGPLSTGGPHEAAGMISFSCVRVGR